MAAFGTGALPTAGPFPRHTRPSGGGNSNGTLNGTGLTKKSWKPWAGVSSSSGSTSSEKTQDVVLDASRKRLRDFDEMMLEEGGYTVEFSNRGAKVHYDPNPSNPRKRTVACIFPGCGRSTNSLFSLCSIHAPKKGRPKVKRAHWADWIGRVIPPGMTREQCLTWAPAHDKLIEILVSWMKESRDARFKTLDTFVYDVIKELSGNVPDSTTLQKDLELDGTLANGLVGSMKAVVERGFPAERFSSVATDGGTYNKVKLEEIPIRIVAALLVTGVASEEANRGDLWAYSRVGKPGSSKRASVFMPMAYYFLRAYTAATKTQARQSVRR